MPILIPNPQYETIHHIFDSHQYLRNVIEAIPELSTGELWVNNIEDPLMALYTIPGIHFLAGTPDSRDIAQFLAKIPPKQNIFVPTQKEWIRHLKRFFGNRLGSFKRYALSASSLSLENIRNLKKDLPSGFRILKVDVPILKQIKESIGFYILLFFGDPKHFMVSGKGYCIKHNDSIISIASSLVPFNKSLEIQIDTIDSPKYRRKGFATQVAVEIIEYCLSNDIEPHWDADSPISKNFALKLGYSNPQAYPCYFWV
ncbi:MAG: GNAT family N-acetyltransferase [Candidatus Thorarchaeota archaeon]